MRLTSRYAPYGRVIPAVASFLLVFTTAAFVASPDPAAAAPAEPLPTQTYKAAPIAKRPAEPVQSSPDPTIAAAKVSRPAPVWPVAAMAEVTLTASRGRVRAGELPVLVAATQGDAATKARVSTLDHAAARRAGVDGLALRVSTPGSAKPQALSVAVQYGTFAGAYGADWARRLRLVALPDCTAGPACRPVELPTHNDVKNGTATAEIQAVSATGTLVALASGPSGSSGSFKATDLKASASWSQSGSTGDFTWTYPMEAPKPSGGAAPQMALSYSAQSVDGRNATTNNQPGPIGAGFEITQSFIERSYKTCEEDMGGEANNKEKTGDLCWGPDNATMSLQGRSAELLKDTDGTWHPVPDDGSKIEKLTTPAYGNGDNDNEYWKVTAPNGTQYWFGRHQLPGWSADRPTTNSVWTVPVFGNNTNEPCHASTFAGSSCSQAWRWNLDYVVDVDGNTTSYWYTKETNKYGKNNAIKAPVDYIRGGYLNRVDYGTDNRDGTEYTAAAPYTSAPYQITLTNTDRCKANCSTKNATTWPDTPWDLDCSAAPNSTNCLQGAPTFWTGKRVTKVATTVSGKPVDQWSLDQDWLDGGDGSTKGLWLKGIAYTGLDGGTVAYPSITFSGIQMPNRVDASGSDWALAMNWWRVNDIRNETGGRIFVTYSGRDCVAGSRVPNKDQLDKNTLRCYPVKWTPEGHTADVDDFYHKYVVTDVQLIDNAGGSKTQVTHYDYRNPNSLPLWAHSDEDGLSLPVRKSWADWRGYPTVVTTVGAGAEQAKTETLYFRGMHGDLQSDGTKRTVSVAGLDGGAATDYEAFAGQPREQIVWNGTKLDNATVTDYWQSEPSASRAIGKSIVESRFVGASITRTRVARDDGTWQRTKTVNTFDDFGMVTRTADLGDEATVTDDTCTDTEYARNTGTTVWLVNPIKRTHSWAGACTTPPATDKQIIKDTRFRFDGKAYGVTPVKGQVTATETIDGFTNGTRTYHLDGTVTFDALGRVTDTTDVTGAATHTDYTPATTGGPITKTVVKNPLGWLTTTEYNPARNLPVKTTDPNNRVTEYQYDAAGRLTDAWSPGRSRVSFPTAPSQSFTYTLIKADGNTVKDASVVTTETLDANGKYRTDYSLYDGFWRPRQTQSTARGGETPTEKIVTDTFYDSAGRLWKTNAAHPMKGLPTGKISDGLIADLDVPRQNVTLYDGAGRVTNDILLSRGVEKWRTTTSYHGDHVDITPPDGGTATSTWHDARGRVTATREYRGATPTGGYDGTTRTYAPTGEMAGITDASGNTWTYEYDIRGRLRRTTDPDRGAVTTTYNTKDQTETVTDAENRTLAYTYDDLGRKTSIRDGSITGTPRAGWTYDAPVKGVTASSTRYVPQPDGTTSAYTTSLAAVDAEYRPRQTSVVIPASEGALAGTYTSSFTYKPDGSPATITMPGKGGLSQESLTYEYDATYATPVALKTNYTGITYYVNQATYTNLFEPSTVVRSTQLQGAGWVSSSVHYDDSTGRIDNRSITRSVGAAYIANTRIEYTDAGDITQLDDNAAAGRDSQCFRYDGLRRLTEAWTPSSADCTNLPASTAELGGPAPYWQSWQFGAADDPIGRVGNRRKQIDHKSTGDITTDYTYPAAKSALPHAVTATTRTAGSQVTTSSYTYDKTGNTITRPGRNGQQTLTWDGESRLSTVTDKTGTSSYLYDADGNRLISRDNTGSTLDLGSLQLRVAKGATTATATRFYSFNGEQVAQRDSGGLRWLVADFQGTPAASVTADANQTLTQRRQTPYGESRGAEVAWVSNKGYLNGQADGTGLTHLGAREYDPALGKFVSVDPILDVADPQQWNAYAYSNNSPVTFSDPSGKTQGSASCTGGMVGGPGSCSGHEDPAVAGPPPGNEGGYKSKKKRLPNGTTYETNYGGSGGDRINDVVIKIKVVEVTTTWEMAQALDRYKGDHPVAPGVPAGIIDQDDAEHTLQGIQQAWVERYLKLNGEDKESLDWWVMVMTLHDWAGLLGLGGDGTMHTLGPMKVGKATGGCRSFSADTKVLMADGSTMEFAALENGDAVLAADPVTGEQGPHRIEQVWVHDDDLYVLALADGRVITTEDHPFWNETDRRWVHADELEPGDAVRTPDGTMRVTGFDYFQHRRAAAYNLTIEGLHTYYVIAGATPVLVHNSPLFGCGIGPEGSAGDRLPAYGGKQTTGILVGGGKEKPLVSGYDGPAGSMPPGTPGFNNVLRGHVEGHAAAYMREKGLSDGILYINRVPCPGKTGCDAMLPRMLPKGSTLRVYGPGGFDKTYRGTAD